MWRVSGPVLCFEDASSTSPANPYLSERYRSLKYGAATLPPPPPQLDPTRLMDGCTSRALIGGVGGAVMGLLMGGFMHTMQPMNVDTTLSTAEQIRQSYKGFGQACTRMSRNFAKVGCVYAGVECTFERSRAQRDIPNAMYAGCVTGAVLAFQAGPGAMAMGCAGFAAFSGVIETFLAH
mmetsp:Transcript_43127/g.125561  ORF Transcript_43127/g.125561 Transcript_43127/m.125561 type:complete len:179 (+) Transcript_43127:78-614(+)